MLGQYLFKTKRLLLSGMLLLCFYRGYPEMLQTNNEKEFINNKLKPFIERIGVDHIFGTLCLPQSQSAIKALSKTIKIKLSAASDNVIQEKMSGILELNLFQFLHYCNCYRKRATLGKIP